jgi:hypothetical protein
MAKAYKLNVKVIVTVNNRLQLVEQVGAWDTWGLGHVAGYTRLEVHKVCPPSLITRTKHNGTCCGALPVHSQTAQTADTIPSAIHFCPCCSTFDSLDVFTFHCN